MLVIGLILSQSAGLLDLKPDPRGDQFATSIAAGADLNGDGVPDLVVLDETDLDREVVWFVSGRDGSVLACCELPGNYASVDLVGDIDRDGRSDVAVVCGTREVDSFVEILSGRDGSVIRQTSAQQLGVYSLSGVRAAGSVDEIGCPDILVGCTVQQHGNQMSGAVLVVSGSDGHVIWQLSSQLAPWRIADERVVWYHQASFAGVGDVDADDRADIAVADFEQLPTNSASTAWGATVIVYSGRTGLPLFELAEQRREADFGRSLDGGIDFDGDLRPDILVGSADNYVGSGALGKVRVYSGRDGSLLRCFDRTTLPERGHDLDSFGEMARFLGDLNGDQQPDVLVGAPEDGAFEGTGYVLSGADGKALHIVEGNCGDLRAGAPDRGDRHLGRRLSRAGDVDRDGVEDFVVGNHPYDRGQFGLVRVFSGKSGKLLLSFDRDSLLRR